MFKKTPNGFQITFANGYRASVIWGNPNCHSDHGTAEFALIRPNGTFVVLSEQDDTLGWLSPEQVTDLLAIAKDDPESLDYFVPKLIKA